MEARGASGSIPHLTEGENSLPGPSLEELKEVVRQRDLALHHSGEMLRALQQVSQVVSKRAVGEPSPSHGRDSPCSWAMGSELNGVSESDVAAGKLDPSGVGSYAPYIGSDGTKGGNISVDKFGSGRARGSYLQPNVIPNSEFRDNIEARREISEYLELPSYEISGNRAGMRDAEYRSSDYHATGPLVHMDLTVQDGQSRPMQTGYVASQHATPFYSPGIRNGAHRKQKEPDKFDEEKVKWDDFQLLKLWHSGITGPTKRKVFSSELALGVRYKESLAVYQSQRGRILR